MYYRTQYIIISELFFFYIKVRVSHLYRSMNFIVADKKFGEFQSTRKYKLISVQQMLEATLGITKLPLQLAITFFPF